MTAITEQQVTVVSQPVRVLAVARKAGRFVARRLLFAIPTLLLVVVFSFLLLKATPGDLAEAIAGEVGSADVEYMALLREQYGLDKTSFEQFTTYVSHLVKLDFGYSVRHGATVSDLILARIPATISLIVTSMLFALVVGGTLGTIAAYHRSRWPDTLLSIFTTCGYATPLYWVGLMLVLLFSVELKWLPSGGMFSIGLEGNWWVILQDRARHLVLPAFTLSLLYISIYSRVLRSSIIDILHSEFIRTAKAKGLTRTRIMLRHVWRNSLIPLVTVTGLEVGAILGGAITIETVFSWPGMGRLAFEAVTSRDTNLLMGILISSAVLIIVANIVLDVLYALIDPRIEMQ